MTYLIILSTHRKNGRQVLLLPASVHTHDNSSRIRGSCDKQLYKYRMSARRSVCLSVNSRVKMSKVKVTWVVRSFWRVRSVARCLFKRFASYVAQIQSMTERCVARQFWVKRSKVKVTRVKYVFLVSASLFCAYSTDLLLMWHKYNP